MRRGAVSLMAVAGAIPGVALLRATTYHSWADGDAQAYARGALLALGIAAVSWLTVRATIPPAPSGWVALPWLTALIVLVVSDVVHYQRLAHPIARTGRFIITDDFQRGGDPDPHTWISEVRGPATLEIRSGTAVLTSAPGGAAVLDLVTPGRPDPNRNEYWLPRGLYVERYDELIEWEASVRLDGEYSVLVQTRQLLAQATRYGLHLTYPDAQGRVTEHHVEMPEVIDGAPRRFRLERAGGLIRLGIGERTGWTHPDRGRFDLIRFGETRPDPLHAGVLTLHHTRYVRRFHGALTLE